MQPESSLQNRQHYIPGDMHEGLGIVFLRCLSAEND
jgi:hypothetical protein